jgi:hypothetical protein
MPGCVHSAVCQQPTQGTAKSCGKLDTQTWSVSGADDGSATRITYMNGTVCSAAGKPRQTTLSFKCAAGPATVVGNVEENATDLCEYLISMQGEPFCGVAADSPPGADPCRFTSPFGWTYDISKANTEFRSHIGDLLTYLVCGFVGFVFANLFSSSIHTFPPTVMLAHGLPWIRRGNAFLWHLCSAETNAVAACADSPMCQKANNGKSYGCGVLTSQQWSLINEKDKGAGVKLTYANGSTCPLGTERSTTFELYCSDSETTLLNGVSRYTN